MNIASRHIVITLGAFAIAMVLLSSVHEEETNSEQTTSVDEPRKSGLRLPSESGSIPSYASYEIEGRAWKVDCYSIGAVYVELDATAKFKSTDGDFLTHKDFCDLYI